MFQETLSPPTKRKLGELKIFPWIKKSYLAGGSAAALHFGHRKSEDLDFFTGEDFSVSLIRKDLSRLGPFTVADQREDTLVGSWRRVKLSLMKYPYKLLEKITLLDQIPIASATDIALMKLEAISSRGTKRDFVDLYWISRHSGKRLVEYLGLAQRKYGKGLSRVHLVKSLSYFSDAEKDPMPRMLKRLTWEEVRTYFVSQSLSLARRFIL